MSEQKAPYTAKFERLEGSRPSVQDDWGYGDDEDEISPLDLSNYKGDEVDEAVGEIRRWFVSGVDWEPKDAQP